MNLGELLGGAGVVGQSWRAEEEAQRVARQNQLAIEEQNRLAAFRAKMMQESVAEFKPVALPQFPLGATAGVRPPAPAMPFPEAAPAAAPVAPVAPIAPASPAFAREDQSYAAKEAARAAATRPQQVRQLDIDRLAMMRAPTAALDVIQAPAAAGLNVLSVLGENVVNIGGRLVNAVTGEEVAPTDVRGPRFGMTPFYDKYVREREQALGLAPTGAPTAPTAAAPAAAAPTQPTKAAQQYDNKVTPYDNLIAQSAQQYGLDPVIFKRLIGTESSFNPTAVSPRGEKFGLGIAQIADVHGLTQQQKLDPNTAIPFAAQLFSQYLQASGGDYEQALQKYKGASSEKGKAAMAAPIGTILSGVTPSAQAAGAAGMTPAPLEVPKTQARNMEMAEFYLAQPESIPYEQQQLRQVAQQQAALITQQRNETARLAQIYMQSGTAQGIEAAMRLRGDIMQADAQLLQIQQQVAEKETYLQGMQGLRELAVANDPRRLAGVLSTYMGTPVGIQPRPDGNYNYFLNGKKVQDNVSPAQLAGMALKEFSPEARAASAKSAALENELALKRKYGDAAVNAMRDIQKAMVEGEYKLAEERAKQAQGKLTVDTAKGIAYFQQGNRVLVISPDGKVEEIGGVKVETGPTARQVAGLNMGR